MPLEKSLKGICRALSEIKEEGIVKDFALIGGLSVSTWGYPRATRDVDLLVSLASIERLKEFSAALERRGLKTDIRSGGLTDPVPYLIRTSFDDVPADIIIATKKWEREACEQAVQVLLDGADIPVVPVELTRSQASAWERNDTEAMLPAQSGAFKAGSFPSGAWERDKALTLSYFSYFPTNGDGKVEIGELFEYIKPQVERIARKTYNNEQSPQLIAPAETIRQKLIER